jgi:hypothetical protein
MERLGAVPAGAGAAGQQPDRRVTDCVYIAASTYDSRFTRICVASVRHFYPDLPIRLLAGGRLQAGLADELRRYWQVETLAIPAGDYGWGFVKLEPLFGHSVERFLILDSDTVLTGPVLDAWPEGAAPFLVDDEQQSESDTVRLYYDWRKVRAIDPDAEPPRFVFNSGQWFGTAGLLTREDFAPFLIWSMPRKLRLPEYFMPGDQGVLNYVLNRKARNGLAVDRKKIMHWPGHGMGGLNARSLLDGTAPTLVVHWAGLKKARLRDMPGHDLLEFFEREYYRRLPSGGFLKLSRAFVTYLAPLLRRIAARLQRSAIGTAMRKVS